MFAFVIRRTISADRRGAPEKKKRTLFDESSSHRSLSRSWSTIFNGGDTARNGYVHAALHRGVKDIRSLLGSEEKKEERLHSFSSLFSSLINQRLCVERHDSLD